MFFIPPAKFFKQSSNHLDGSALMNNISLPISYYHIYISQFTGKVLCSFKANQMKMLNEINSNIFFRISNKFYCLCNIKCFNLLHISGLFFSFQQLFNFGKSNG